MKTTLPKVRRGIYSGEVDVCCHRVSFWCDLDRCKYTDELTAEVTKEAERRSGEMIARGCHSGELCLSWVHQNGVVSEFHGWWKIEQT